MHINKFSVAMSTLAIAAALPSFAAQQMVVCPLSVAPASIQLVSPTPEWKPFVKAPLYLHAAAPIYGPPEARGEIADFTSSLGTDEWSYTYKMEGDFSDGKWIQCAYGANNEVTLSTRINDKTEECTFTYRKGRKVAQHEIKIQCR